MTGDMENPLDFSNVDRRLALTFGGLILALMVIVLLAGGLYLRGVMEREEDKLAKLLAGVLAESVNRVSFSGKYQARLLLEELKSEHPEIRYLLTSDPGGHILAHSDPTLNDKTLDPVSLAISREVLKNNSYYTRTLTLNGESIREVMLPYRGGYDNKKIGVIQVGLSQQARDKALHQGRLYIATLALLLMVIGAYITRTLSSRFGRPIKQLAADMAATLQAIPDLMFEVDSDGRYLKVMAHREELLADTRDRLLGHTIHEMLPKEAAETVQQALLLANTNGEAHGQQILLPLLTGPHWFELSVARKRAAPGEKPRFIILSRDITERQQAHVQRLMAASVFESSREGILITDSEQRIIRVNPAFCHMLGYDESEVLGQTPAMLQSGTYNSDFYADLWSNIMLHDHWQGEVWDRCKTGEIIPVLLSISVVRDADGAVLHYVSILTDISSIKESEARLEHLARHDPLTGLANRLMLHIRLEHALDRAQREGTGLALLMIDLDQFKDINDSFGHAMGDALLKEVAQRLTQRARGVDTVSRLGGDEFTILLEDLEQPDDAARLAQDIIILLGQPVLLPNKHEVSVGASIGIALFPDHGSTEAELLQQADAALYQAKAEGRGRYQFFTNDLTLAARQRIALEMRLRRAVAQNELVLHYQPQVDASSGRIVGAEALVRWHDPIEGLIPPADFIPMAEQSGLIVAIGDWVLRETCLQGVRWAETGLPPLSLAVNVSSRQFQYGDLAGKVSQVLQETGFPAERLELELTESVLMKHQQQAMAILAQLRTLGVRIAIDDFGTGYSSLAYLKGFPLDVLKIDKSFVNDIPLHQDDMEIAATIIAMAHTLRLQVLAEGVENQPQLDFLKEKGCDRYQGFLMSRPLPADDFAAFIQRHETGTGKGAV
ncbi:MAG: EAL domain-containing protein [Parasulfuritortus sp.]|nr:EAL domain-containing protein [Parasulfuritortus sp.]